jgi:DNA-binding transcriptional LysR family regulator
MNITLRQVRAFVAAARLGRFALAAEQLHVTPSALSMLIRQLEAELGLRLFDRHTRMLRLTEAGAAFLAVAEKTLADLEHAVAASREVSALRRGRVSVATSTVLSATLLPWAARKFAERHPGIAFALRDVAEEEILGRVRSGDVDLGVGTMVDRVDATPEIDAVPLFEDSLTAVLGERHPLAERATVTWRELGEHPLIVLGRGSPIRALQDRALAAAGITAAPAFEVSFSSTVISMVAAGLGVAPLPVNARQVGPRVKVQVRPLMRPTIARRVAIFRRRETALSPAAAAFEGFLRDYVRSGAFPVQVGQRRRVLGD